MTKYVPCMRVSARAHMRAMWTPVDLYTYRGFPTGYGDATPSDVLPGAPDVIFLIQGLACEHRLLLLG